MDTRFNDILARATSVFQKYGIRSVSMDDISSRLGISKKTLYSYVSNKKELVEKTLLNRYTEETDRLKELEKSSVNAIDFLLEMSRNICLRLGDVNPTMIYDLRKYHPDIFEKLSSLHRGFYSGLFMKNLEDGIKQGLYRQDIDKELTIRLYLNNIEQFFGEEIGSGNELTPSQVFRVMFGNHIRAIASPEGLAYFEAREMNYNM